jgi:putative ABC transport system ATP-binding protein
MSAPMIALTGLRKTFARGTPDELPALQGIDLDIDDGAFVVIVGTNGSGKSTLLNAIAGTVMLDAGTIRLDGVDITSWPEHRRARLIGRVFQNPFSGTAPRMSIAENLALAARRGRGRSLGWALSRHVLDDLRARVAALNMRLEDRLDQPIGSLSGGQRQALTLLMATWLRPGVLLLDEHTAALDPKSADLVVRLSEEIVARERLTAVMVTHSMAQAANIGSRLVMMHRGRVLHLARFEDVRRADQLDETVAELLRRQYV